MSQPKLRWAWILFIPLLVLGAGLVLIHLRGPFYMGYNFDPDYVYLMNSVRMLYLYPPTHIDHPGTTVQIACAALVAVKFCVERVAGASESLRTAILYRPETFLNWINYWFLLLPPAALAWSGFRLARVSGMSVALFFQIACFVFPTTLLALVRVTPDPFIIAFALLLISVLHSEVHSNDAQDIRRPIQAGLLLGAGIATKFTFLPMILLILLFRHTRRKAIILFSALITFVFITFPILKRYPQMAQWIFHFLTRKGGYGEGEPGLPSFHHLRQNAENLFMADPFFFITTFLVLLCAIFFMIRRSKRGATLLVLAFSIIFHILITVKNPASHYLLVSMIMSAWGLTLLFEYSKTSGSKMLRFALPVVLMSGGLILSYGRLTKWSETLKIYAQDVTILAGTASQHSECRLIPYYRSSIPLYALAFGNDHSGNFFRKELLLLHPDAVFYYIWSPSFYGFDQKINTEAVQNELEQGRCFWLQGTALPVDSPHRTILDLTPIEVRYEALYRLNAIRIPEKR